MRRMIYGPNNIPSPSSYANNRKENSVPKAVRYSGMKQESQVAEAGSRDINAFEKSNSRQPSYEKQDSDSWNEAQVESKPVQIIHQV